MDGTNYINFNCQHCRSKIRVPKIHAGKRGKCPRCGRVITIPFESAAIELQCGNCGLKISVPNMYEGKEGFCPKCKYPIPIPREQTDADENHSDTQEPNTRLVGNTGNLTLLDVPKEYKFQEPQVEQPAAMEIDTEDELETEDESTQKTEPHGQRKLPWLIDIFLYPISIPGLIHFGMFTILPLLISVLSVLSLRMGFVGFLFNTALTLYMLWYFNECVRDSAKGGIRAPEAFATADLSEMWAQAQHIIGCYLIFIVPFLFYYLFTKKMDTTFWLLLSYGIFFLPMGLLSCIMFDSIRGLNPILLFSSILSTFLQYSGLLLLFAGIILSLVHLISTNAQEENQAHTGSFLLSELFYILLVYLTFVTAHLLGRFYWRNQEKLNWEV